MNIRFIRPLVISMLLITCSGMVVAQANREEWQPPEEIMDAIGVKPGMVIGEAGAGRGYMTFPLAKRVGDKGRIYANDISRSALDAIESRAEDEGVGNIVTVMGEIEDPVFPEKDLDMIIMVYVLHMLERPLEFMENLKKYLGEDGRLVIVELNAHNDRGHPPSFMSRKQVIDTIQGTDYILERTETFLPKDTIYVLSAKKIAN